MRAKMGLGDIECVRQQKYELEICVACDWQSSDLEIK